MRKPVLLIAALVVALAVPVLAQEAEDNANEKRQQASESPASELNKPAKAEPKPRSRPAQSFTPSEKIRADTSVAFPADI